MSKKKTHKIKVKKAKNRIPYDGRKSYVFDDKRLKRQKTRQTTKKKAIEEQDG